jgi:drug/metabolite transporter (DMT)-like permease
MLWIPFTLIAAAAQTARNAMQSGLTASLGTLGLAEVLFAYAVGWRVIHQRISRRQFLGMGPIVVGVGLLLVAA